MTSVRGSIDFREPSFRLVRRYKRDRLGFHRLQVRRFENKHAMLLAKSEVRKLNSDHSPSGMRRSNILDFAGLMIGLRRVAPSAYDGTLRDIPLAHSREHVGRANNRVCPFALPLHSCPGEKYRTDRREACVLC